MYLSFGLLGPRTTAGLCNQGFMGWFKENIAVRLNLNLQCTCIVHSYVHACVGLHNLCIG